MNTKRRLFLKGSMAAGVAGVAASAGLAAPMPPIQAISRSRPPTSPRMVPLYRLLFLLAWAALSPSASWPTRMLLR